MTARRPPEELSIRAARPRDAPVVEGLVQRAYGHYPALMGVRPAPMDADYHELVGRGIVYIAESDALAGVIVLHTEPDHLLVENVAVAPERQGTGIGRTLMRFAEDEARRRGLTEVRLYTHERMRENIAFYLGLGYSETERRTEAGFERVFFRKRVGPPR